MTQSELVNRIFNDNAELINQRIEKSKFPMTFKLLNRFDKKSKSFLNSIQEAARQDNFYVSQILTRVVIEHFLVAYYVWTKARKDEDDECATEYYSFYGLQELMKQDNYNSKLDKTYDNKKTPLQNAASNDSETFGGITEEDILDLNQRANKFDIRKILVYLKDELDIDDEFKDLHPIILDFCKKYNRLSSFVHGGPISEFQTYENRPKTDYNKVIQSNIDNADLINFEIKTFVMLLLMLENTDYFDIYKPIFEFVENKTAANKSIVASGADTAQHQQQ